MRMPTLHLDLNGFKPSSLLESESIGFPPGFGGWNLLHSRGFNTSEIGLVDGQKREQLVKNRCQVYLGWVNSQLRKKKEQNLIEDMGVDMADGTVLAAVIEVVAGERLEIIPVPSQRDEKVMNVNQVLHFMKANRIPMHPISAEEIVSGDLRSIMRLILALAARYRPNTVKQTSRHGSRKHSGTQSIIGYAQSAAAALTDARKNASIVVPKPEKPSSLNDRNLFEKSPRSSAESSNDRRISASTSRSASLSSKSCNYNLPKSSSQDFSKNFVRPETIVRNDAKYEELASQHDALRSDHRQLRIEHDRLQSIYCDISTEVKILKKSLVSLNQLLEGNESRGCDGESSVTSEADVVMTTEDLASLKNQLVLSEDICSDVKEDLSKTRNECLRLQGAEIGLNQRLHLQQKEQFSLKAELKKSNYQIQQLLNDKKDLERQLLKKDEKLTELNLLMRRQTSRSGIVSREPSLRGLNLNKESNDNNAERIESHFVVDAIKQLKSQFESDNPHCETLSVLEEAISDLVKRLQICECINCSNQNFTMTKSGNTCDSSRRVNKNDGQ